MTRLARGVVALRGWRRVAAALTAGAVAAAALPPVGAIPLLAVAFTVLMWLIEGCRRGRTALVVGWCFGLGHFVAGLYWTGTALLTEPAFAWMIPFAVVGLPAVLAVFTALAVYAAYFAPGGVTRVVALAAAWTAAEWLRGHVLTGFPWNLVGYSWADSDAMLQTTASVGIYGLSLITVLAAAAPATLAARRWMPPALAAVLLAALWGAGTARLATAEAGDVPGVRLRIVQANIAQHHKWREDRVRAQFNRYLQLSSAPGVAEITHFVWPETATPAALNRDRETLRIIGGLARPTGLVLTGALRATPEAETPARVWNSLYVVDWRGEVTAVYDKFHLVPFGEYVPLRALLGALGVAKITAGRGDFSAGPGPRTLELPGLPPLSPLICYEAIFPGAVTEAGRPPAWFLNITNDAWFGRSSGPYQHFAMARVRAVENGIPLVRAANTGISAIVDAHGRTLAKLGVGESGVLDGALPSALEGSTLYARVGDWPLLAFIAAAAVFGWRARRRHAP
jgi:apolipoprotein N-acyltransferase